MATQIGVDNLVYATMTTEGTATTPPVWEVPKPALGVMSITINANASQETLFADNGPYETAATLGNIEVEIQKTELTTENKADLLGHAIDSAGGLVSSSNDSPPWVAVGFRALKSNGKYRYVWLYQGKFMEPEDSVETKGDAVAFQTPTISGQFATIATEVTVGLKAGGTVKKKPWKYDLDEESPGMDATVAAAWFTAVTLPKAVAGP